VEAGSEALSAEFEAGRELKTTIHATIAGAVAVMRYALECCPEDEEPQLLVGTFEDPEDLLELISAVADGLAGIAVENGS
jgi:hypothetical protein